MEHGVITELGERGSGLIKRKGAKEADLFFHADSLAGITFAELRIGDKVAFTMTESKKGPYALRVERL